MITSYASLDLAVKATNIGAFDFVPKPFTPQELKTAMESIPKHYYLRRMTRKLHKEGKQVRFQFLTVLSHELKTPLSAIEGFLKIMQEKQAGDRIDDYQKMIDSSISRIRAMRTLIMDMLDLTRIESGKSKHELREIDLGLVAKSAIDTMMPMAIQRDVSIDYKIDTIIPYPADTEEMEIVFSNLISNAVKFNVKGGKVHFNISLMAEEVLIEVVDTGIGIAEEDIPKLFHEFSRIKNHSTKDVAGSGLGLSIVKRIIDLYHGRIEVKSRYGEVSTFSIILPNPSNIIA